MGKKTRQKVALKSHYPLTEVKQKIATGRFYIGKNAQDCALRDFGWNRDEIITALKLLEEKHFFNSITSHRNSWWVCDVYKARLFGEKIYVHLYIDDSEGNLIINSFKKQ